MVFPPYLFAATVHKTNHIGAITENRNTDMNGVKHKQMYTLLHLLFKKSYCTNLYLDFFIAQVIFLLQIIPSSEYLIEDML